MHSILSMDAYNRGYNAALDLRPRDTNGDLLLDSEGNPISSDAVDTQIGNALIITNSSELEDSEGNKNIDDDISVRRQSVLGTAYENIRCASGSLILFESAFFNFLRKLMHNKVFNL